MATKLNLAELAVNLYGKDMGLRSSLAKARADVDSTAKHVESRMKGLADSLSRAGSILSVAVSVPVALAGRSFVKLAMDAQESKDAMDVIFDALSAKAIKSADTIAKSLKRSKYASREYLTSYYSALKEVDNPEERLALSEQLLRRTYDIGSLYNKSTEETMTALMAALRGEWDPAERLNIFGNETAVQKYIAQHEELAEVTEEVAKKRARLGILMEQSQVAEGNVLQTKGSPANRSRALVERYRDTATRLGEIMLPTFTKAVDLLQGMVDWFDRLSPAMKRAVVWAGALAFALGPVMKVMGWAFSTKPMTWLSNQLFKAPKACGDVLRKQILAQSKLLAANTTVTYSGLLPQLIPNKQTAPAVLPIQKGLWSRTKGFGSSVLTGIKNIPQMLTRGFSKFVGIIGRAIGFVTKFGKAFTIVGAILTAVLLFSQELGIGWDRLKRGASKLFDWLRPAVTMVKDSFVMLWDAVKDLWKTLKEAFSNLRSTIAPLFESFKPIITLLLKVVGGALVGAIYVIATALASIATILTWIVKLIKLQIDQFNKVYNWALKIRKEIAKWFNSVKLPAWLKLFMKYFVPGGAWLFSEGGRPKTGPQRPTAANNALDAAASAIAKSKAILDSEIDAILGEIRSRRQKQREAAERERNVAGFGGLREIWNQAMVAGARSAIQLPNEELTAAQISKMSLDELKAIRDHLKDNAKEQKEIRRILQDRLGKMRP